MTPSFRTRTLQRILLLGLIAVLASPGWSAPGQGLSRDLETLELIAGGHGKVDIIITYRDADARRRGARAEGLENARDLPLIQSRAARIPVGQLRKLADDLDVSSVTLDEPIAVSTDVAVPALGATLARQALGIEGEGVRVAIIDSGIEPGPGFGGTSGAPLGRIVAWVDLVEPQRRAPTDPFGHGTHVAGIIAGAVTELHDSAQRRTFGGVAPAAEIVSVRVLDREGKGRTSDVIAGLDWVVAHREQWNIRVVNLSLGHPIRDPHESDPLVQACERAWDAGVVVVVSAGNLGRQGDSYGTITSPGNSPKVLTVGALVDQDTVHRGDDQVATYSSRGPTRLDAVVKPDLMAPGDSVVSVRAPHSLLDRGHPENRVGSSSRGIRSETFFRLSGTSMAAAAVSGGAALLLSQSPDLDPDALKARMMSAADPGPEDIFTRGAGALDLMAALELDGGAKASLSPLAWRDELGVHLETALSWGPADVWPMESVYGPLALWDASVAFDIDGLWPETSTADEPVIWEVPPPGDPSGDPLWERAPGLGSESVVWQIRRATPAPANDTHAESVVWQVGSGRKGKRDDGVSAESVVWQSRPGPPADDWLVSAESVVWQADGSWLDILIHGDRDAGGRP